LALHTFGDGDRRARESVGTLDPVTGRKFNDEVDCARRDSRFGTAPFIERRRFPALGELGAHDGDNGVGARFDPGSFRLMKMSVMERIVLSDDGRFSHKITPLHCRLDWCKMDKYALAKRRRQLILV
jgi:hypothetical protein